MASNEQKTAAILGVIGTLAAGVAEGAEPSAATRRDVLTPAAQSMLAENLAWTIRQASPNRNAPIVILGPGAQNLDRENLSTVIVKELAKQDFELKSTDLLNDVTKKIASSNGAHMVNLSYTAKDRRTACVINAIDPSRDATKSVGLLSGDATRFSTTIGNDWQNAVFIATHEAGHCVQAQNEGATPDPLGEAKADAFGAIHAIKSGAEPAMLGQMANARSIKLGQEVIDAGATAIGIHYATGSGAIHRVAAMAASPNGRATIIGMSPSQAWTLSEKVAQDAGSLGAAGETTARQAAMAAGPANRASGYVLMPSLRDAPRIMADAGGPVAMTLAAQVETALAVELSATSCLIHEAPVKMNGQDKTLLGVKCLDASSGRPEWASPELYGIRGANSTREVVISGKGAENVITPENCPGMGGTQCSTPDGTVHINPNHAPDWFSKELDARGRPTNLYVAGAPKTPTGSLETFR
jgi:hypothetical protein